MWETEKIYPQTHSEVEHDLHNQCVGVVFGDEQGKK